MTELIETLSNYLSERCIPAYLAQTNYRNIMLRVERLDETLQATLNQPQKELLNKFLSAQSDSIALELNAMCQAAFAAAVELTH